MIIQTIDRYLRRFEIAVGVLLLATLSCAAEAWGDDPLAPASTNSRLLVAVTDDDFLAFNQDIWCQKELQGAIEGCREQRAATYMSLDPVRAGSPSILRGGRALTTGPRRLICFVCDDQRRILNCCIGIPSTRQLLTLCEDADELAISMWLDTNAETPTDEAERAAQLTKLVRERASERVTRHYRPLLDAVAPNRSVSENANTLAQALAEDIKERFLIDSPIETERWTSAQQHAEARRHWCETMLASFVGKNVDLVWPELAASVWGAEPWRRGENVEQFATWCSETLQSEAVVLEIDPKRGFLHAESIVGSLKTPDRPESKRMETVSRVLGEVASKTCDLCQLACAFQDLHQSPVALRNPKSNTIRWVIMEKQDSEPILLPDGAENRLLDKLTRLKDAPILKP